MKYVILLLVAGRLWAINDYIEELCKQLQVPVELAMAILEEENPRRNSRAVNINTNGTVDRGLWQINSSNEHWFLKMFGLPTSGRYNPLNDRHSTWWAIHYLHYLRYDYVFTSWWETVIAYNCGPARVINRNPPNSSIDYAVRIWVRTRGRFCGL